MLCLSFKDQLENFFSIVGLLKPGLFKEAEQTKKEHVNNVEGLKAALANFQTKNKFEWAERLDVTAKPVPDVTGTASTGNCVKTANPLSFMI